MKPKIVPLILLTAILSIAVLVLIKVRKNSSASVGTWSEATLMQPEHANGASSTSDIGQSISTTPVAEEDENPSGDVTTSEKENSGGDTPITNTAPNSAPPKDAETIQSSGMRPGRPMGIGNVHLDFSTPEARAQSVEALAALDAARKERVRLWLAARNSAGPAGTTEEDLGDIFDIENGEPIYVGVFNAVAGFSSNVGWLQDRTLKGRDMVIGVWDGGNPRVTHVEFGDRVRYRDTVNTALNQHATHVIGTIAAEGKDRSAMGMAPAATVEAYSFNGDVMGTLGRRGAASAEQAIDTSLSPQNRLIMVSNHSWGPIMGWNRPRPPTTFTWNWVGPPNPGPQTDSGNFGIYDSSTQNLDVLCAVQPYHLPIFAVGNDRSNNPQEGDSVRVTRQGLPVIENYSPAIHPTGDGLRVAGGYRTASGGLNASKNVLTVGAVEDAITWSFDTSLSGILSLPFLAPQQRPVRTLSEAVPTSFTGYGPTADGRLKPEVVANGAALHSTIETGDNAYGNSSGTSMATPTVSGIALLLQERHINLFNHPMRASTLKALILHSADDLGTPGPDYQTGYGLVNAFEAEKIISGQWEQQSAPLIREEVLIANHMDQHEFFVPTLQKITLCWTDPTIRPIDEDNNSQLTSQLEHDLDLRVFAANGQVFQPWILSPANPALPAIFGDNSIDNVEQIVIPTGVAGPFRVVVTSKEPLTFAIPRRSLPPRLSSINSLLASQNNPAGQVFSLILSGADKSTGTIAEALDNTSLKFTIGGANAASSFNWISQADVTQDGIDAARSSRIRDNEQTWIETTVTGPGELAYWVKVDAAPGDGFQLHVNGSPVIALVDGTTDWQEQTRTFGPGTHQIRWVYSKNSSGSRGHDALFLDQVSFLSAPHDLVAIQTGSITDLSWKFDGDGDGYELLANPVGPFRSGSTPTSVNTSSFLSAVDTSSPPGTWYSVRIYNASSRRYSPSSVWVQGSVRLLRPTSFQASLNVFTNRIRVTWDPVASASEYLLTRTPEGGAPTTVTVNGTSYDDLAAVPGVNVTYSLIARDGVTQTESAPAGPVTGSVLDPSTLIVKATDNLPGHVLITWGNPNGTDWFRCVRTTTDVSPAAGNSDFVEIGRNRVRLTRWASFRDFSAQIGLTYRYWAQVGSYDPSGTGRILWGNVLGSDTGSVQTPGTVEYQITHSDLSGGPLYHWVDISQSGTQIHGRQLITPTAVALEAGSEFFPVRRLIDNSGLNTPPTLANLESVSHGVASDSTAWVTSANVPDYYTALPSPRLLFHMPRTNPEIVGYELTDLVIWAYHFGFVGGNEGRVFHVEFLRRINVQGDLAPTGQSVTVTNPQVRLNGPVVLPLGGSYFADAVRITITDNWFGLTDNGGDRVGLGEVKFIGNRRNANSGPSVHGYIAVASSGAVDDLLDSTNDCPLPAIPSNGGSGLRIMPWHDALETRETGAVFFTEVRGVHPGGNTTQVYQWENVRTAGGNLPFSFQALHFTESGDWLFQYKPGHPGTAGASVGIQNQAAGKAATYSCNTDSIPTDRPFAILFKANVTNTGNGSSPSQVWTVTTLVDKDSGSLGSGAGDSLREILKYATGNVDIVFPPSMAGQTLPLLSPLEVNRSFSLDGGAAPGLVISGRGQNQIFRFVSGPNTAIADIQNLTLADGWSTSHGGAILTSTFSNQKDLFLRLENVTIRNCRARNGGAGGAIAITDAASVSLVNCTLSGCRAEGGGGALSIANLGANNLGSATLINCTLSANFSSTVGGGILADAPGITITSSIIAGNSATAGNPDISGIVNSRGRNVIGNNTGATGLSASDKTNTDARLGTLGNNGGPTWTHALRPDSPAIDFAMGVAGDGIFLATDQRGVMRGADGDLNLATGPGGPDSGAFELDSSLVVTTANDVVDPEDGRTSLREAVLVANHNYGGTISFDTSAMGSTTCNVASPLSLFTPRGLTFVGGGVTLSGNGTTRLLHNQSGSSVLLEDLTIAHGNSTEGAGILNLGQLGLARSTLRNHSANRGAAIHNSGSLVVIDSTFSANAASDIGGAIYNAAGDVALIRTTFSANTANKGAALGTEDGTFSISNSTILDNIASQSAGALLANGSVVTVSGSILAGNSPDGIASERQFTFNETGINLIQHPGAVLDPVLLPLGNYGGPTQTMPPAPRSPALDRMSSIVPIRVASTPPAVAHVNSPIGMGPEAAFDGNPATKYVNLDPALVAHWPLDTDPASALGPWHGVTSGNLSFGHPPAPGLSGLSADFVSGSIQVPWNEALNPGSFTVTLWVRADVRGGGHYRSAFTNRDGASGPAFGYMLYNDAAGNWSFWSGSGTTSLWDTLDGGRVQTDQWMHLAVSYDHETRIKRIFVNGVLTGQKTATIAPNGPGRNTFKIGSGGNDRDGLVNLFDGRIDDVALWNQALEASAIAGIMGHGTRPLSEGLVLVADNPFLAANAVSLTAADDNPDADPATLTLEGSHDGVHFEPIGNAEVPPFAHRGAMQIVEIPSTQHFRHYRLALGEPRSPRARRVQIAEIELVHLSSKDQRGLPGLAGPRRDLGAVETGFLLVNTAVDENDGISRGRISLRDAIQSNPGGIIQFDPTVFTGGTSNRIVLTHGTLIPTAGLAIDASDITDGITISGAGAHRILEVRSDVTVIGRQLTLRQGFHASHGGGIRVAGSLVLNDCRVVENTSTLSGGGMDVDGGTVVLRRCTVADNTAGQPGGGIRVLNQGHIELDSCTLARNRGGVGAGIRLVDSSAWIFQSTLANHTGAAIQAVQSSSLHLISSTVSENVTGIARQSAASVQMENSIVAGNSSANVEGVINVDLGGNIVSGNPRLAPLRNNGGPTQTMALRAGSPALDIATSATDSVLNDQRGFPRRFGPADSGAFESHALSFVSFQDVDGDGMDDEWEQYYGLNPLDPSDASSDLDGDGVNALAEFFSRTDPTDATSLFRAPALSQSPARQTQERTTTVSWTSFPGLIYSVWSSEDLVDWTPVENSNLIAISTLTSLTIPVHAAHQFYQIRLGAAPGIAPPMSATIESSLVLAAGWSPEGMTPSLNGQPITTWQDILGATTLTANGGPSYQANASPIGVAAAVFRAGNFNDAFAGPTPSAFFSPESFTVAAVFNPSGNGEFVAGSRFSDKSQIVSANTPGNGNGWGLGYADNSVWFGVGDSTRGPATLQLPAGAAMTGRWWIAIATWTADDGNGSPSFALWLYDENGNEVARQSPIDPNAIAGTQGAFSNPRSNTGIAIGADRAAVSTRNFAGKIITTRLYPIHANRILASGLADQIAREHTTEVIPD